jgi:methyl-accepting chemotaxis protein
MENKMKLSINLTVTQRIGAGFSLLVILMLIMSFFSYKGLNKLNDRMVASSQQIVPMLVNSGTMGVSLLSVNRAVMQFLFAKDAALLDEYEESFGRQYQSYLASRNSLQALASTAYPEVISLLDETSLLAQQYLDNSKKALLTHRKFIAASPAHKESQRDLQKAMSSLQADLDDLVAYGDGYKEISAATTLSAQLAVVVENVSLLRNIGTDEVMLETTTKSRNAFGAMVARNNKLAEINSGTASGLEKKLDMIANALDGGEGVLVLAAAQLSRINEIQALLVDLTTMINAASYKINELMILVESKEKEAGSSAIATASSAKHTNIGLSILSIIIAIIIGVSVCRSIKQPLKEMMYMLRVMANGDMTQRIKVVSRDEFADLSNWMNQLAEKLLITIEEIHDGCYQVTKSTSDTAKLSAKTKEHMLAQSQKASNVSASMAKMLESVKGVVKSTLEAQQAIADVDKSASDNRQIMNDNTRMIQELSDNIANATDVINRLNEDSDAIGHILDVIRGVADQTNLLALNAAIEAARAGEQGRGFAVVADEVRTLASRTQKSTEEIQSIIQKLQQGASEAVTIMQHSSYDVQQSVAGIDKSFSALNEMVGHLDQIRSMSDNIGMAAEDQNISCDEVSDSIRVIASMSEDCSKDASQIVVDSEKMVALAKHQQTLVEQFKLK